MFLIGQVSLFLMPLLYNMFLFILHLCVDGALLQASLEDRLIVLTAPPAARRQQGGETLQNRINFEQS